MKHILVDEQTHYEVKGKATSRGMTMVEYISFLVKKDVASGISKNNKTYNSWSNMMNRCYNLSHPHYSDYGGRKIEVSSEFKDYFKYELYVSCLDGYNDNSLSIDRVDNNGDYIAGNLKYSTSSEQNNNQRMRKNNKSGYSGVIAHSNGLKWQAEISVNGKKKYLGLFETTKDAAIFRNQYIIDNGLKNKLAEVEEIQ